MWLLLLLTALTGIACDGAPEDDDENGGPGNLGGGEDSALDPLASKVVAGPPMVRNLSNREYLNAVSDLLGVKLPSDLQKSWTATTQFSGFDSVPWANLDTKAVRDRAETLEKILDRAAESPKLMVCKVAQLSELGYETCAMQIVEPVASRAFGRPLTAPELASVRRAYESGVTLAKTALTDPVAIFADAIRVALGGVFFAPQFLTRTESAPTPEFEGERALSSYELASRLSFMLLGSLPDDALWASAQDGTLASDRTVIERHATRLLRDHTAAFVQNFMGQWFDFRAYDQADPASLEFAMWNETWRTLVEVVRSDLPIGAILKPGFTFLNDTMAAHYGIAGTFSKDFQKHSTDERGGILQQGSWLTLSATPQKTSPIHRGLLVQDRFLCKVTAPPDSALFAKIKSVADGIPKDATVKQRLDSHRKSGDVCFGCHQYMDPIGLGLESFDQQGKVRTIYADTKQKVETDTDFLGKPFSKVSELNQSLSAMPEYERCAAEKLAVFALRKTLDAENVDSPLLNYMTQKTSEHLSIRALVLRLVQSKSFLFVSHRVGSAL